LISWNQFGGGNRAGVDKKDNGYKIAVVDSIQVMSTETGNGATGAVTKLENALLN